MVKKNCREFAVRDVRVSLCWRRGCMSGSGVDDELVVENVEWG